MPGRGSSCPHSGHKLESDWSKQVTWPVGSFPRRPRFHDFRASFPGTMVRGGSSTGTPARSTWLIHYAGRSLEIPKSWQREYMLTLEGIYRPHIPQEAPHLHEPSAFFNLQLLVLPGRNSNHDRVQRFTACKALHIHDIIEWYNCLILIKPPLRKWRLREGSGAGLLWLD